MKKSIILVVMIVFVLLAVPKTAQADTDISQLPSSDLEKWLINVHGNIYLCNKVLNGYEDFNKLSNEIKYFYNTIYSGRDSIQKTEYNNYLSSYSKKCYELIDSLINKQDSILGCSPECRNKLKSLQNQMKYYKQSSIKDCREKILKKAGLIQQESGKCYAACKQMVDKLGKFNTLVENIDKSEYGKKLSEKEWNQLEEAVNAKGEPVIWHIKGEFSGQHWIIPIWIGKDENNIDSIWFYDPNGARIRKKPRHDNFFAHPSVGSDPQHFYRYFFNLPPKKNFWQSSCR